MVKAVAQDRGNGAPFPPLHPPGRAENIETDIGGDAATQFAFAEQLHRNFYEDTLDRAGVTMRLEQVATFVDSLHRLLPT